MTRQEFEALRDHPDKTITEDIRFKGVTKTAGTVEFRDIEITSAAHPHLPLVLNGSYTPRLSKVKFNVMIKGLGPICRVDVNGVVHGAAGRTHKHSLVLPTDPLAQNNLPHADARPDLVGKSPREVFEDFCERASIEFTGHFYDP